ncbi:MAG: hypothetical protein AB2556_25990 [Candidatus Thiodiazotropha sp.]
MIAKDWCGWKPAPASLLQDIQRACVEHGHDGLWNSMGYDTEDIITMDTRACYPASFQGMGEVKPYFERFGHPTHRMTRVAINGALPKDIGTGFAESEATCHPVIPTWFGRHFADASGGWAPTQPFAYLTVSGLLRFLKVREAIVSLKTQRDVWLPCPRAGTRPALSSANSPRAARQMEKG